MRYTEKIVTKKPLKSDLICYWEMKGIISGNTPRQTRYVPKGQSLLIFNFGNSLKTSERIINNPFFVVPFISESLIINQIGNINLFGISFRGDGLYKLFQQTITQLNQSLPNYLYEQLDSLHPKLSEVDFFEKCILAEKFIERNLNLSLNNITFNKANQIITQEKGKLAINQIAQKLNISQRQIQRLFKERIGITPKVYSKLIRVGSYLDFILENPEKKDWMDLVVEFNYHDQPHLIKEVKAITKLAPEKLIKYQDTLFHLYRIV